ncbi:cytochrome c assembly protein [Lucifera butyrica]|uniref:Cytochrome c assembly protein n=1 Tax=Lucifera butyrica TaxID=1351585 RepID=A0A498RE17_9FIRM|nr:c-type cytochrome biogenesis protein CcsB [Lucifera butyrica]VBB09731.1 cytochrome c assembly protein [Lucifera butyrica]
MAVWEAMFLAGTLTAYFCAGCLYLLNWLRPRPLAGKLAALSTFIGWSANTLILAVRTVTAGHAPLTGSYEFGLLVVWGLIALHLYWKSCSRRAFGQFILPAAFLLTGVAVCFYRQAGPLLPALKSNWLLLHVMAALTAYVSLVISFVLALAYLCRLRWEEKNGTMPAAIAALPDLGTLDTLVEQAIRTALPLLTLAIGSGAVWAENVWGTYWNWDPKETWSLITWLVYTIYLHGRTVLHWRGKQAIHWVIAGFMVLLFTFIGVTLVLPGLHGYG